MLRLFAAAIALSCISTAASTQPRPSPATTDTQAARPPAKPAARKPAEKNATPGKQAPVSSEQCGLGVIVSVGDEFMMKKIGLNPFGNDEALVSIDSWGLDDLVFARVRAAAPRGIAVRRIPYTKSAFLAREESRFQLFRDRKAELVDIMRQVTNGTPCQRYVLISKSISRFRESSHTVRGIGIVDLDSPLGHRTYLFALSYIQVFDGRNFSIIRQGSALTNREPLVQRMLLGELILGPHSELSGASFPSLTQKVTDNLALREYARVLLTASLDKTLPMMLRP